jgi:transglutaminase-like putative cysteine protease
MPRPRLYRFHRVFGGALAACEDTPVQRVVTAEMDLELGASVDLIFQIAAAQQMPVASEQLTFTQGDRVYTPTEIIDQSGSRLHRLTGEPGTLHVRYEATIEGQNPSTRTSDLEAITYLRPSRYCQSDEVFQQARRQFKGLHGHDLIAAVSEFVSSSTTYTPGLSHGTDSAVTTLMTGQGVCRDYAHVIIALLRAMDMPARYAACYAPGLRPMDFHAVAEAYLDGAWYVIDGTRLANRRSLVRIATGRDAADCAFLSYHGGYVGLPHLRVDAWVMPEEAADLEGVGAAASGSDPYSPAHDDFTELVQIA